MPHQLSSVYPAPVSSAPSPDQTHCPIHHMLSYIGNKWAILILRELFQGNRRTNEFLAALPGISTKTLTARLRELESHGLVTRTVYPEVPPRVEYALTAKGREIQPIMAALSQVGQQWLVQNPPSRGTPSHDLNR